MGQTRMGETDHMAETRSITKNDELLTVDELAAVLKVNRGWIYQRIHSKSLPFGYVKVGHYPRFPRSGVERFLEDQLQAQGA
jgi:excisionase family DNA binding protein